MRLIRLAILGQSPCERCHANCCKQNGHAYAALLWPEEYGRFGPFSEAIRVAGQAGVRVERVLPYVKGRCQFLGEDDRCTIYQDRPRSCREFQCIAGYHGQGAAIGVHSEFLQRNGQVLGMLEAL